MDAPPRHRSVFVPVTKLGCSNHWVETDKASLGTMRLLWRFGSYLIMPRGPRSDAPGVLHHVMARGIMRQAIFRDDSDRNDLIARHMSRITPIG
jgi:hypothetical protein